MTWAVQERDAGPIKQFFTGESVSLPAADSERMLIREYRRSSGGMTGTRTPGRASSRTAAGTISPVQISSQCCQSELRPHLAGAGADGSARFDQTFLDNGAPLANGWTHIMVFNEPGESLSGGPRAVTHMSDAPSQTSVMALYRRP